MRLYWRTRLSSLGSPQPLKKTHCFAFSLRVVLRAKALAEAAIAAVRALTEVRHPLRPPVADTATGADAATDEAKQPAVAKAKAVAPAVDARMGLPRQFVSVQINSGPHVGKFLEISVSFGNTTVGGLAHLVKQEMQKMRAHGGVTTVRSFKCEEETFEPGRSHQVATKLALPGCQRDAIMVAFLYDERFEFGHTSLFVQLHTLNSYTEHTIFFSPTISSFCDVVMRLSYILEHALPGLATVLRGFNESGYKLVLDGKEVSRSSWGVGGFDGFDLREAPSRSVLQVKMPDDDGAISSGRRRQGGRVEHMYEGDDSAEQMQYWDRRAAECSTAIVKRDVSVKSALYVKDGGKIYDLYCCLTKTTMS